jgi:hypothetical protein
MHAPLPVGIRAVGEDDPGMSVGAAGPGQERWKQRATIAEINGRRVNEAIEPGGEAAASAVFVCECGHLGCSSTVELDVDEYEDVRTDFDRFLVIPGHEIPEVDQVVERHPQHLVVVKREGEAKARAWATDGRSARGG